MKKYISLIILLPIICAIVALVDGNYWMHVGVPVTSLLSVGIASQKDNKPWHWIIMISFVFCIAGDWMLGHQKGHPERFVYGIFLFLIAHIGYLVFCLKKGRINRVVLAILLLIYLPFFIFFLYPAIGVNTLLLATFLYLVFSCLTLSASAGLKMDALSKLFFILGVISFVLSDTLIAFNVFLNESRLYFLMMPGYYLSHIFIALAIIQKYPEKQRVV